jgi:hypothetical protein
MDSSITKCTFPFYFFFLCSERDSEANKSIRVAKKQRAGKKQICVGKVACCEPPAGCDVGGNYNAGNNTASAAAQADCEAWRKAGVTTGFCSRCSLCQAAVAENIRHIWHKIALLKVIALLVLVPAYFITCCYFKQDDDAPGAASTNYQRCLDCCFNVL